ncbi:adult-specific rigid cuticular protein 15.7 [Dermacentor silvarum]|uniref:adult-specific rigid cuticular protein 15.7 n=1 Tax=Dermacentor silvarum TaxID=543639 RepID=UPI0021008BCA|nr:adult-specific rigid cuticular protein 15.7 [Dermacentor silvarum]
MPSKVAAAGADFACPDTVVHAVDPVSCVSKSAYSLCRDLFPAVLSSTPSQAVFVALCLAGAASGGAVLPAPAPLYAPAPVLAAPRVYAAPAKAVLAPVAAVPVTAQSYSFGYNSADEFGTRVQRQESSDVNNVRTGSYGYADANGIFRHVQYVADAGGFRAAIDTNEPGTAQGQTAGALYNAAPLPAAPVARPAPVVAAAPYKAAAAVPVAASYAAYAKPAPAPAPLYAPAQPKYAAPAYAPARAVAYGPKYL